MYNSAKEAAWDMRRRGLEVEERCAVRSSLDGGVQRASPWQRVGQRQVINGAAAASEELSQDPGSLDCQSLKDE